MTGYPPDDIEQDHDDAVDADPETAADVVDDPEDRRPDDGRDPHDVTPL